MRVLLWVLGVGLLLILAAALLLPKLVDERALIAIAADRIEAQSGVKLTVDGATSLSLFPDVALTTSDVSVRLPNGDGDIQAKYLQAGVALLPLFSNRVEMESITVEGLSITTVLDEEAAAAARAAELDTSTMSPEELDAFYAARAEARKAAASDAAASALAAPLALQVGELVLKDIHVRSMDSAGKVISELQLTQLTGKDLNTAGRPIPLTAQLLIPGETEAQDIDIVMEGSATVALDDRRASLNEINVWVTGATPDPVEITLNGETDLDTQISDLTLKLSIGTLKGNGTVRFDSFGSPMIDADLKLTELNPALLVLAGPDAAEAAENAETAQGDGDAPLPLHPLRMIDTRAALAIDTVVLDAHELKNVVAELRVLDGVATLDPVTAMVHGGQIDFTAILNGRYNTATVSTAGGVTGLDIAQALTALEADISASGSADLTWNLEGSGSTSNELINALNGPIDFTTADITLEDIAMQRMFCQAVALVNQESLVATYPNDTQFEALQAKVQLDSGVATLDPLTATLSAVALTGTGILNLDTQELRASLRAQLNAALGEEDPACRINERYAELRWPVECKGNLAGNAGEWCGVNTTEIVKDLAEYEARRKVEKGAGKVLKKLFE